MRWKTNPKAFVTEALRATPEDWQVKALDMIAQHDRVAIRSGHGVGKTTLIAWIALWFLLTRIPTRVPITANSQDQLRDVVWPALAQWARELPGQLRNELDLAAERVSLKAAPEEGFAVARTASRDRPEALQGFHSENMLFVLEEASGIPEEVILVAQGALSTPGAKVLMVGNPTRGAGYFYDAFHGLRDRWVCLHVSSEDVERARGHIEDIAARYGKDSNQYRVRVLGEFPIEDDDVVIPLHLCEAAMGRAVEPLSTHRIVWGVDVARFGDDRSALAKRQGNTLLEPVKVWANKDIMQTAGIVMDEWNGTWDEDKPKEILVDAIGLGAGVADRLKELGLPIRSINVAERPASRDRYERLRDELWFRAREWLEARDCAMPDDAALIAEITDVRYEYRSTGKIKVESKDQMKERALRSPDLGDAFVLTFAAGLERKDEHVRDRYARKRKGKRSAWAA